MGWAFHLALELRNRKQLFIGRGIARDKLLNAILCESEPCSDGVDSAVLWEDIPGSLREELSRRYDDRKNLDHLLDCLSGGYEFAGEFTVSPTSHNFARNVGDKQRQLGISWDTLISLEPSVKTTYEFIRYCREIGRGISEAKKEMRKSVRDLQFRIERYDFRPLLRFAVQRSGSSEDELLKRIYLEACQHEKNRSLQEQQNLPLDEG